MKFKKNFVLIVGIFVALVGVVLISKSFVTDSSPLSGIGILLSGLIFVIVGIAQRKGKTERQKE